MTNQQLFVLISTFIVGMLCGAYLYTTSFAPTYSDTGVNQPDTATFNVQAEQIGGCQRGGSCASFVLFVDRSYRYLASDDSEVTEGTLSRGVFADVRESLTEASYVSLGQSSDKCAAAYDGIDYRYEVTLDGVTYILDSCGTQFTDSDEHETLLTVWGAIAGTGETEEEFQGAAEIIINRFGEE